MEENVSEEEEGRKEERKAEGREKRGRKKKREEEWCGRGNTNLGPFSYKAAKWRLFSLLCFAATRDSYLL